MQQLHLVGVTTDSEHLIFSARTGAKSGGFLVPVDDDLVQALGAVFEQRRSSGAEVPVLDVPGAEEPAPTRPDRPQSLLSPREIQARLRAGRTVGQVAREAAVEEEWVERFAAPVLAEQRRIVDAVIDRVYDRPRRGPSAEPLRLAVRWNLADRGIRLTDDEYDARWSAFNVTGSRWAVVFEFVSRKRVQHAEWEIDLEDGELVARNRLASDLAYVEPGRRRRPVMLPPPGAAAAEAVGSSGTATRSARTTKRSAATAKSSAATAKSSTPRPKAAAARAAKPAAKKAAARRATPNRPSVKKSAAAEAAARRATPNRPSVKKSAAAEAAAKRATPNRTSAKKSAAAEAAARKAAPRPKAATARAKAAGGQKVPDKRRAARKTGPRSASRAASPAPPSGLPMQRPPAPAPSSGPDELARRRLALARGDAVEPSRIRPSRAGEAPAVPGGPARGLQAATTVSALAGVPADDSAGRQARRDARAARRSEAVPGDEPARATRPSGAMPTEEPAPATRRSEAAAGEEQALATDPSGPIPKVEARPVTIRAPRADLVEGGTSRSGDRVVVQSERALRPAQPAAIPRGRLGRRAR